MGNVISFMDKKNEMEEKVRKVKETKKINDGKSVDEFDWKDWKHFYELYNQVTSKMYMCFSQEEMDEWTWKIFTHLIKYLIDDREGDLVDEEMDNFIAEATARVNAISNY